MEMPYVFAVVITGLVVVFLGLVLLIAFISIIGKIFTAVDAKKKNTAAAAPAPKAVQAPAAVPAPVSASDDDEVIAVISAAVAMMGAADGKAYRVKSIKAAAPSAASRSAWAMAGLRDTTSPF
ncbi:MAG: OadG family protein [Oscillospiraceae bacterium]|nr:OadG family protein [Oscillospiraceae bacterium]